MFATHLHKLADVLAQARSEHGLQLMCMQLREVDKALNGGRVQLEPTRKLGPGVETRSLAFDQMLAGGLEPRVVDAMRRMYAQVRAAREQREQREQLQWGQEPQQQWQPATRPSTGSSLGKQGASSAQGSVQAAPSPARGEVVAARPKAKRAPRGNKTQGTPAADLQAEPPSLAAAGAAQAPQAPDCGHAPGPKRGGRKKAPAAPDAAAPASSTQPGDATPPAKRGRGRPKKGAAP
uniref:Uncharacterized protein n=1 Tax=Chlamydomonas leiostraca TaxID=1034604 RepID=A0A7S0WSB5_9CHLO|mmetsp:Transcript_26210/g.66703  ORF Transcript_26210/g.66703 Transcript_26210/m.66703 type:complete len:236 (+) Transcript_26210:2-709(+)